MLLKPHFSLCSIIVGTRWLAVVLARNVTVFLRRVFSAGISDKDDRQTSSPLFRLERNYLFFTADVVPTADHTTRHCRLDLFRQRTAFPKWHRASSPPPIRRIERAEPRSFVPDFIVDPPPYPSHHHHHRSHHR